MKSVPETLFFKAMKEPPSPATFHHVDQLGIAVFTDGTCIRPPYLPGEKCLDKSTGKVVTILSCEPVRVEDVTEEDCVKMGITRPVTHIIKPHSRPIERIEIPYRDWFIADWHKRHPGKEWAWRVVSEEESVKKYAKVEVSARKALLEGKVIKLTRKEKKGNE